jgi:type III restriction enzyme
VTAQQVVDANPIINDPFTEPTRHWKFGEMTPQVVHGRRESGYLAPSPDGQLKIVDAVLPLQLVNDLRDRVRAWRSDRYPGATATTRTLFGYWFDDARKADHTRPFFAQQEAIETIAFLVEGPADRRVGVNLPDAGEAYERRATKMATGTGKTLVMGLLITWSGLNKAANRQDARFVDRFLVVCPGLTVLDRLMGKDGIDPRYPESVYNTFDLLPPGMSATIGQVHVQVSHWHKFAPKHDPKRGVVQRGPESDGAFARRVLTGLPGRGRVMVINDEAHHAWRLPPDVKIGRAEKDEAEEATVWIDGLERIHRARGIMRCHDFSATPMYGSAMKQKAWTPFEWIVSDFALVDSIESGMVKIPRTPTDDNTDDATPKYRNLWEHVKKAVPKRTEVDAEEHPLTDYLAEADGPLKQLAGQWERTLTEWQEAGRPVPPVMIVVCHDTPMSRLLEKHIAEMGEASPELVNRDGELRTIRIDTDALDRAEEAGKGKAGEEREALRQIVATVGKQGEPGEQVRCLVSVKMLAEGWDARNVTQILGLRAFQSQLLVEQVVGRGLRRSSYADMSQPEYVDVYGVPFQLLPIAKGGGGAPVPPPDYVSVHTVNSRPEHCIKFPRVVQIIPDVVDTLECDFDAIEPVRVRPQFDPTDTWVELDLGSPHGGMGGETQDRNRAYEHFRVQRLVFRLAAGLIEPFGKPWLFPQAVRLAEQVCRPVEEGGRVHYEAGVDPRELCNLRYLTILRERVGAALIPSDGGERYLPALDEYAPVGTTDSVDFNAPRDRCVEATRSHLSHAVCDSGLEKDMCTVLDEHRLVASWVKNHRLYLEIPYIYMGTSHRYRPDFVLRLINGLNVLVEGKGDADEKDDAKATAARMWVAGVSAWGQLGTWSHAICYQARTLGRQLEDIASAYDADQKGGLLAATESPLTSSRG